MSKLEFQHYPIDVAQLPQQWSVSSILALDADVQSGFPTGEHNKDGRGIPHIRPMNIDRNGTIDLTEVKYVAPETSGLRLQCGDVLFNNTNSPELIGKSAAITQAEEWAFSNHMTRLRFSNAVDFRFAAHQLHFLWMVRYFRHRCVNHVNQASISGTPLSESVPFLLAPLNEQRRIVAKIEELFSDLDAGVAALKRAKANLKRYRAAVLKAAIEGMLTEQWRTRHPETEPASKLLERILVERRKKWESDQLAKFAATGKVPSKNWKEKYTEPTPPDTTGLPPIPDSWTWATLDALAGVVGGITKDQKKANKPGKREVPYLRVANVQRGFLDLSEMKSIAATEDDIAELRLEPDDVLFTEGGDRDKLGRGWVWSGELSECIHQNHIFRGRLLSKEMQSRFVSHHGNTFGRDWFIKAGKQTTNLASINLGILRRFPVPIPPATEQAEIVAQVDEKLSQIDAAETQIDINLLRAARLRQSILKQAFGGKLVPQNPKDEPASVLLQRIRAELAAKSEAEKVQPKGGNRKGPKKMTSQERRQLLDVLKKHSKGLSPEDLLQEAGYALTEVDDFYSELRSIATQIEEVRPAGAKIKKWPKAAKILLRAKRA